MSPRAPRVLVSGVVLDQPMGGVRRHAAQLWPRLAARLAERGGALAVMEGRRPVPFELPPTIERIQSRVPSHPAIVRAATEGRELRRVLGEAHAADRPFDLVHTGHLPAPRGLPVPYTITVHDLRALQLAQTPMSRRLVGVQIVGRALRDARRVLLVSETVRAQVVDGLGIPRERTLVVPNGCDHFEPLARDPAPAVLLHVGHVEPRKNLALLIAALARDPALPALVLAGAPKGREADRLRAAAAAAGVSERVTFRGPFEERELGALYAGAACAVFPSHLEGFGIGVLEAMRARAPVAAARAGALPETAGGHAELFQPDDPDDCARAIRAALGRTPAELDRAAEHAAAFTWDRAAQRHLEAW